LYDANKVEINLSSEFSDFIPATNQHDKANKRLIPIIFEQNRAILTISLTVDIENEDIVNFRPKSLFQNANPSEIKE